MRLLLRALFAAAVLGAAIAANAALVTGTVTAASNGVPLAGKIVAAYDASGTLRASATTDGTGLYVIHLDPGAYRLLAYDPTGQYATTFDANAESFENSPLRTIPASGSLISFALVRGGSITGDVRNTNGSALPGMIVEAYNLSGTRRGFTTTNASGDYSLVLPPGEYKIVAYDATGFHAQAFFPSARSFADATPVRVDEGVSTDVGLVLGVAARVSGSVIDATTQAPLASMLVYAFTSAGARVAVTSTDAAGQFRFALPAGDYRFVAADAAGNYATAYYDGSHSFATSRVIVVSAGEQRSDIHIALTRGVRIRGRVNAPNLVVAAYNLDGTLHAMTTSDAAGAYTLVVAPGDYRIAVSDFSGVYATRFYGGGSDFRFAQTLHVISDLVNIDVTLPRGGRVSGTVRTDSGQPLHGITVAAYDVAGMIAGSATTGADGRYSMVVAAGTYRVLAFDPQLVYATSFVGGATSYEATAPVVVETDAALTIDFTMRWGVRVSGTVSTDKGTPLTGVEIFALDSNGNRAAAAESVNGAFAIVVPAGTYRFIAIDPFRRYVSAEPTAPIVISEGQIPPSIALTLRTMARRRAVQH